MENNAPELPDEAIRAFDRIWKKEAIGGDYQIVIQRLKENRPRYSYSAIKKYKEIIATACGFMGFAIQDLPDGANKKRLQNFIKTYSRYER